MKKHFRLLIMLLILTVTALTFSACSNSLKEKEPDVKKETETDGMSPEEAVEYYISNGLGKNEAIKKVAKEMGLARNDLYNRMVGR